jgi:hypothetical protein
MEAIIYVSVLQPHYTFTDVSGTPWRYGTIIMLDRFPHHCGFLDYDRNAEQILLHKSQDHGPIITGPEGFVDCPVTYRVWVPISDQQADEWLASAYAAVDRGEFWSPFDNCQNFVSKSTTGKNGSPTRDAIIGGAILLGGLKLVADLCSKQERRA